MNNRRTKLIAGATVLGLGALGGVAMSTNQGLPSAPKLAANGSVVTSASGSTAAQPAAATANTRAPIVTRASGSTPATFDD